MAIWCSVDYFLTCVLLFLSINFCVSLPLFILISKLRELTRVSFYGVQVYYFGNSPVVFSHIAMGGKCSKAVRGLIFIINGGEDPGKKIRLGSYTYRIGSVKNLKSSREKMVFCFSVPSTELSATVSRMQKQSCHVVIYLATCFLVSRVLVSLHLFFNIFTNYFSRQICLPCFLLT